MIGVDIMAIKMLSFDKTECFITRTKDKDVIRSYNFQLMYIKTHTSSDTKIIVKIID